MDLIQVVPGLPPRIDGIGDYALKLAHGLRDRHGIRTSFLVCNPQWQGPETVEGFRAQPLRSRTPHDFRLALAAQQRPGAPLLVQFAVYGYQQRGCPFWLMDALAELRATSSRLIYTTFHELEARSSKPWKSTFWAWRIQKSLILRLARLSSFTYTNLEIHRQRLSRWGAEPPLLIPNFSTLGEPETLPPFARRKPQLIVFGRSVQRRLTYELGADFILPLCQRLGIERILDIGAPMPDAELSDWQGIPIIHTGILSEAEIQQHFATSLASFQHYPVRALGKSSIYAVSCAFGTLPFVHTDTSDFHACSPLVPGEDFFPLYALTDDLLQLPDSGDLAQRSTHLFSRYQQRNTAAAADTIAAHILA